jgi:NAD(P)-dependent dehydrogenase (short-subunit alcohol dehydrogenase family)
MKSIFQLCGLGVMLFVFSAASSTVHAESDTNKRKVVLVTGASTGIGRNITEKLASEGHFVYAGARKQRDIDARLDVTVQDEIDTVVKLVESEGRGLHGVVNNAGVLVTGPLIEIEESELDFLFDVNIYGPYRITKAFAPMLIETKGRVINISSVSGVGSGRLIGAYSMSKHAIEAYTDSLALELELLGVKVSAVEPGDYQSNIARNYCDRLLASGYDPTNSYFAELVRHRLDFCKAGGSYEAPEPDAVAEAVLHALIADAPKEHYLVVPNQEEAEWTIAKAIEELVSLNKDHPYSYTRDELVEMLDAELASEDPAE